MGWNHWNSYGLAINSSLIIQNARTLKRLSLDNYRYIIIDDGWQAEQRDANGKLAPDPIRFPNMRRLVADIHSLGFKAGIYSDAGLYTCGGYPGSLDFEQVDALTFAEWGFDYLKYDNCYAGGRLGTPETSYNRFKKMSDALLSVKHINPIIHSLSNWGDDRTWYWAHLISNSYRISGDIYDYWDRYDDRCPCDSMIDCKLPGWKCSVSKIIEFAAQVSSVSSGPGRFMDLDMLVVGLGRMTTEEYRTHFTFWCILKSPLILGNKLYEMTVEDQEIVRNQKLIDINQDSRGAPAQRRWNNLQDNTQMWAGPLSNGFVVVLYNKSPESRAITASFADIFLDDEPVEAYKKQYKVVDLWSNDEKGKMLSEKIVSEVPSHGVKAYRIYYPGNAVNREL